MIHQDLQPLSLGSSTLSTLRLCNEIYVDKTAMVYELAKDDAKVFLVRPRRFGKSLLLSTFESLFKHGLRDFKGLAIENLWHDKTYTVVRLDFSESQAFFSSEEFAQKFYERVESKFNAAGLQLPQTNESFITRLSKRLQTLPGNSLVLLIDEYDAPLTACLQDRECFNAVRSIMSKFFLSMKANQGCFRFIFVTGITKLFKTTIFSAFNNLTDISLDSAYGTLLGFTENELTDYFGGYIGKAADKLDLSQAEVLEKLRQNYDGYSFNGLTMSRVYCPWSVLNFLRYPHRSFENYWYQSGGHPTMLMKHFSNNEFLHPSSFGEMKKIKLDALQSGTEFEELSVNSLLTQAGYLTIKSQTDDDYLVVDYPNQEVEMSMAQLYADELLRNQNRMTLNIPFYAVMLANDSVEIVIDHFNKVFNVIDFNRFPVSDEASCRAFLQVLLIGAAMIPCVNTPSSHGSNTLEVEAGNRHWVFEIKFARKEENVEGLLAQAVDQVKSRRYSEFAHGKELLRVAMVFSETEHQFVAWEAV